ncbi:MAG: hypothetical protein P1S60_10745 [Anaerolineae bacterium]|nr:hypothetical protein [Anaerolineae bacterium]
MKMRSKVKYVVLQEYIPVSAQKAIKRSIRAALPLICAPQAFVEKLNQDLIVEARQRYATETQNVLKTYGILGGSALSIAGGFLIWMLLKKQRETSEIHTTPAQNIPTGSANQPISVGQA